jgi:hypothetical protein
VVIKADAGTYGMGIMTAHSADDVRALNRKQRTRMAASKGGSSVSRVILQEGVYTFETWNGAVAEPVVYMIDRFVVGGFYRVHTARGANENLNAPGMHFEPLAFADSWPRSPTPTRTASTPTASSPASRCWLQLASWPSTEHPPMAVSLGVVMDPIGSIKTYKDSTFAMLLAAQARGWEVRYMELADLFVDDGTARERARWASSTSY